MSEETGSDLRAKKQQLSCQVCGKGLTTASTSTYCQRKRVCPQHLRAESVTLSGRDGQYRFCHQCGKFQPLTAFDGVKRSCRERLELRRRALNSSKDKGRQDSPGSSTHTKAPQRQNLASSAAATGAQAATAVGSSAAAAGDAQHYAAADVPDDIYSRSWGVQQMLQYGQVPGACTAAAAAAANTSPLQPVQQQMLQPVLQQGGQRNGNLPLHHATSVGDFDDYLHAVMQDELQSCLQQQQQHEDAATLLQPRSTLPSQSSAVQGITAQAPSHPAQSSAALLHPGTNAAATWGAAPGAAAGGAAAGALPQIHVSSQAFTGPPLWPAGQHDAALQGTAPTSARRQLLLQQLQELLDLKAARMQDTAASGSVPTAALHAAGLPAAAAYPAASGHNQGRTTVFAPGSSTRPSPTLGFGLAAPALQGPAAGQHMAALQQLPAMQPALCSQELLMGVLPNPALPVGFSAGMQGLPGSTSTLSAPLFAPLAHISQGLQRAVTLQPLGHTGEGLQRAVTLQPLGHTSEGLQRAVTLQHQQGAAAGLPGALSRTGISEQMEALQQQVQEASAQLMKLQESLGLNAASS